MSFIIDILARLGLHLFKKWIKRQDFKANEISKIYEVFSLFEEKTGISVKLQLGKETVTKELIKEKREREKQERKEWDS